jgi:hypothetical protein
VALERRPVEPEAALSFTSTLSLIATLDAIFIPRRGSTWQRDGSAGKPDGSVAAASWQEGGAGCPGSGHDTGDVETDMSAGTPAYGMDC